MVVLSLSRVICLFVKQSTKYLAVMRESIGDTFPEVSRKKLFLLLLNFLSKFLLKSTFKLKYNEIYYLPLPSASGKGYTGNSWHATITKVLSVYGS